MTHNEATKKKQGDESSTSKMHRTENPPLILQQEGDPLCPVASFEKYMAHIMIYMKKYSSNNQNVV